MDACERYLAIYDDKRRWKLDFVPTFVQYVREEFIHLHKDELTKNFKGHLNNNLYFDIPYILGFEAIFAPFPLSAQVRPIKINDDKGNKVRIGEDGQPTKRKTSYYEGGYIRSIEILDELRASFKQKDKSEQIKKVVSLYEEFSPYIFPIPMISGIFDRVWTSMGMDAFSRNFRKKTKLYQELIKFYAEIARTNIGGLIEATAGRGKIVNLLDDVAFKGRLMISPERWEQDFLPLYKEINKIIADAGMIPQIHSDGDVTELIPSLQKAGFRGLQGWEGGCDPFYINEKFPDFVVVGFGDVSDVLPFGTVDQVVAHVKKLMDALKANRHFAIGPSTVIVKEMPLENVKAFMGAARKYGKY